MFQILLVSALCIDAFSASIAYGIDQTKIPISSAVIINVISTAVLVLAMSIGSLAKALIPINISRLLCFVLLFILGSIKCFEFLLKKTLTKRLKSKPFKWKLFDINFVLTVYADNIQADSDHSKVLSAKEAVYLAIALSLDGFAAGFGSGLIDINYLQIIILSLLSNIFAISLGYLSGKFLSKISDFDFSWISGAILIILAFTKLI